MGSAFSNMALAIEKMALLAPMPAASDSTTTNVKPDCAQHARRSARPATASIDAPALLADLLRD